MSLALHLETSRDRIILCVIFFIQGGLPLEYHEPVSYLGTLLTFLCKSKWLSSYVPDHAKLNFCSGVFLSPFLGVPFFPLGILLASLKLRRYSVLHLFQKWLKISGLIVEFSYPPSWKNLIQKCGSDFTSYCESSGSSRMRLLNYQ